MNKGMTRKEIIRLKLSTVHYQLIRKVGKAPQCVWNDDHKQGGHGFEWANVSGTYTNNLEDYLPMCISCHRSFDTTDYQRKLVSDRMSGKPAVNRVRIAQYKDNELIAEYDSMSLAAKSVNTVTSNIANHLAGRAKRAKGFTWRYL